MNEHGTKRRGTYSSSCEDQAGKTTAKDNTANSSDPGPWAIRAEGLKKSFGSRFALKGIDLKVRQGKFITIFGPNGAGKTTLIKILATLLKPSAGSVLMAGMDLRTEAVAVRRKIGVVGHNTFLYDNLTAFENLRFYGKLYDVPNLEDRIKEVINHVGMGSRLHQRVRTLSRGMQQRISIARALIHDPEIVLLDEPETGLDQYANEMMGRLLSATDSRERTVIMTTHSLERGLALADQIVILVDGRVVYEEMKQALDLASLHDKYRHYTGARG